MKPQARNGLCQIQNKKGRRIHRNLSEKKLTIWGSSATAHHPTWIIFTDATLSCEVADEQCTRTLTEPFLLQSVI